MIAWLAETWLATSALMMVVLGLRGLVARHFGPRAAYALWALPALRMVLPPLPTGLLSIGGQSAGTAGVVAAETGQWSLVALGLLSFGALAFFGWHAQIYARYSNRLRASASPIGVEGTIEIGQTTLTPSPVAFGVIGKSVMLPGDFEARYEPAEQRLALAHELTHHKRGDLIANVAALGILSLHWFSPIAHFAFRAFRQDQEAACDAAVLHDASDAERQAYGSALVKSALGAAPLVACRISGVNGVKARLSHIISARETAVFHDHGLALACVVVLAGLGLSASAMAPAASVQAVSAAPHFAIIDRPAQAPVHALPQTQLAAISSADKPIIVTGEASDAVPVTAPVHLAKATPVMPHPEPAASPQPSVPAPVLAASQLCGDGGIPVGTGQHIIYNDGMAQAANFVICARPMVNAAFQQREAERQRAFAQRQKISAIGQLQRARLDIANDGLIPLDQKAELLAAIDTRLEEIVDTPV